MKILSETNFLRRILLSRVAFHIYFWTFFFLLVFITPGKESVALVTRAVMALRYIGLAFFPVYFHFFVFEKYFYKRKYILYAGLFIPVMILYFVLIREILALIFNEKLDYFGFSLSILLFVLFATSIKVLKRSINERFLLQEIESKQVQTELELLKAQINPHFLFNTLNNLYGMARKQDKATADGIAGLSHLMRYMIHDSKVNTIQLDKEIEQIRRLIDLQKLRFSEDDKIDIDLQIKGDTKRAVIPPMLMIPFVENAFKHGISVSVPSFIRIHIEASDARIRFFIQNSLHHKKGEKAESDPGLGLENVKRRLELLYPDSHELGIRITDKTYEVELTLERK